MSLPSKFRKPTFILTLIASVLIGLGVSVLANSAKGKEIYADVWLQVFLHFFLLLGYGRILSISWKTASQQKRVLLLSVTGVITLLAISNTSHSWQYLPCGRISALETANQFLNNLKNEDSVDAFEKLSPITKKHLSADVFHFPIAQPISWHLENMDRRAVITGSATFSDGIQLPIEIRLNWINNKWRIYGVKFGQMDSLLSMDPETMPRVYFMYCCDNFGIVNSLFSLINGQEEFGYNFSR